VKQRTKLEYFAGVLALEIMYRYPTLKPIEHSGLEVGVPQKAEATTARKRLKRIIKHDMQQGQTPWDVYITVKDFKQVMDVSHDTAYRWLERFEEAGILHEGISGSQLGYNLNSEYASIVDPESNDYKSPEQIISTASELLDAVEDA
jgi:DNA-binding transcriptional ArsR family regulator